MHDRSQAENRSTNENKLDTIIDMNKDKRSTKSWIQKTLVSLQKIHLMTRRQVNFEGKNDETWKKSVKHILNTSSKKSVKINDVSSLDESFVGMPASSDFKIW